ncbi:MAG TPA: hypothetical protein VJ725_19785 [Thermoanaerobaculia bacterium]|nr:hypothetical protein [Thermoanaerobaculia bacterium]
MRKALLLKLTLALTLVLAASSTTAVTALPTCSSAYCAANPNVSCVWFGKVWNCYVWLDSHCC